MNYIIKIANGTEYLIKANTLNEIVYIEKVSDESSN
tara:strand:- start:103 stop:210 length:108 start_codon:yes stop_codon:yes gene_type:complete